MATWVTIPLQAPVVENVDETVLKNNLATLENGYYNDEGGHSRFPGLVARVTTSPGINYIKRYKGDLIAVTDKGRVHRVSRSLVAEDVTGVVVGGGKRVTFTKTEFELLMAAGREIVRYRGRPTELLSPNAPQTTHIAYVGGRVIALVPDSQGWRYTPVGDYETWPEIDIFAAEGKPDNAVALLVSEYEELMVAGEDSLEQFEQNASGERPFYRRWMAGEGVLAPYTLLATNDGVWGVNEDAEFVRFIAQSTEDISDPIQQTLDEADDMTDAWATEIVAFGQKWILLQLPRATNIYGTKGITLIYDVRHRRWNPLYGWDADLGTPTRWPGWSHEFIWGKHYIGGDGVIYELSRSAYDNAGTVQRMLGRTGHYDQDGVRLRCDDFRVRMKRGQTDPNAAAGTFSVRVKRDNATWTPWVTKSMGAAGQQHMTLNFGPMGAADTFQWEYRVTDGVDVQIAKIQALMERV